MTRAIWNRVCMVLAFGGIFVAGFLSLRYALDISIPCGGSSGCDTVAAHPSSKFLGLPVAYYGLAAYLTLAALCVLRVLRPAMNVLNTLGFFVAASGTLISGWLIYVSLFQIGAKCNWCMASAGIMFVSMIAHGLLGSSQRPGNVGGFDWAVLGVGFIGVFGYLGMDASKLMGQKTTDVPTPDWALEKKIEEFLPPGQTTMGSPTAPIVIVEFGDLLCPHCRDSYFYIKDLVKQNPGKIQFAFRHFALLGTPGHEFSGVAALVSEYAAEKGQFWPFLDKIFELEKEQISLNSIYGLAGMLRLDTADMHTRIGKTSDPTWQRFYADRALADQLGLLGTPCFLIGIRGGPPELEGLNTYKTALQAEKYQKALKE